MVVEYNATATCATSNNIKVVQITPQKAFTLDITNIAHVVAPATVPTVASVQEYGDPESQCYAPVANSMWNGTAMVNDYGVNDLYFELIAANFNTLYKPSFQLTGLKTSQTATITYDAAIGGTYATPITAATLVGVTGSVLTIPAITVNTAELTTDKGIAIYIKVSIKNNGYEGLSSDPITLAVDGVDDSGLDDVTPAGVAKAAYAEFALQTLNLRPTVTALAPTVFISQLP
jgi:hypothetical protein